MGVGDGRKHGSWSRIELGSKYQLSTYNAPGTVLDSGDFSSEKNKGSKLTEIIFQLGIGENGKQERK